MGLALEVGMLADLLVNDEEGAQWFDDDLAKLNGVLALAGLAPHNEPREADPQSAGTYGYSGLHYLRRCAAHLHYAGAIPPSFPADAQPIEDAHYARYGVEFETENEDAAPGAFAKTSSRRFDHLIMHSDAEGFYVPQKFEPVVIAGDQAYGWVGSAYALIDECERLGKALGLPPALLANGEDLAFDDAIARSAKPAGWNPFRRKSEDAPWHAHAIAAMMCAKLYTAATHSVRTGALLVFC